MQTTDGVQLLLDYSSMSRIVEFPSLSENQSIVSTKHIAQGTIIGPVSEVHIVKNDRYCNEIAIKSITNPEYTTYVVFSREEERFVNESHDHKQEIRSSSELLANLHELGRNEGKVTRSHKQTWAAPSTKETSASPVIFTP